MRGLSLSKCDLVAAALVLVIVPMAFAQRALPVAETPPMGWNSWDSFGLSATEAEFKENVAWFDQHLKPSGWQYVVVDEGWYLANPESGGKPAWQFVLDEYGRYQPASNRFPSAGQGEGFKVLADYVHSLGLKFGLHIIRGIPREAVEKNLPIANSVYKAAEAADTSDTCAWNPDNYGLKESPAGQAYYDSIARLYAGWGLDFLKVDCISSRPHKEEEIRMLSMALRRTGRPIVLSLSPGPTSLEKASFVAKYANMWRISDDVWDEWRNAPYADWTPQNLHDQFATAEGWAPYTGPGHWPDADMLPIGYLGPRPGWGQPRETRLTHDEQRTMLTLWSVIRSPLMLGNNLTKMDDWTSALLTNPEVIRVNQHSKSNRPLIVTNRTAIWRAQPETGAGCYLAVFNLGDTPQEVALDWNELGLEKGVKYQLRDLWERKDTGIVTALKVTVAPHASMLFLATEAK
jgi:hypothetical protein